MDLDDAKALVLEGVRFGAVYPMLDGEDGERLKEWFVMDPRTPVNTAPQVQTIHSVRSPVVAVTGNACPQCQGVNLVRTGSCVTCQDCGHNEGCG